MYALTTCTCSNWLRTYLHTFRDQKTKINEVNYWTLLFKDFNATDNIFTDMIIHTKFLSVKVMSVIIMSDKVIRNYTRRQKVKKRIRSSEKSEWQKIALAKVRATN